MDTDAMRSQCGFMTIESWAVSHREEFHAKPRRRKVTQRPTKTRSRRPFVLIPSLTLWVLTLRRQQSCQNGERRDPIKTKLCLPPDNIDLNLFRRSAALNRYARIPGLADSPW